MTVLHLVAGIAASAGVALAVQGQTGGTPAGAAGQGAAAASAPARVQTAAARAVTRLALIDLRLRENPSPSDARICTALLDVAIADDPGNEDLVRTGAWVADLGEDDERAQRYLRRVVELDPRDTFAQYRLIAARLRAIQNADERLVAYERFLGPQGKSLDPSIRSRLATDASSLLFERGDDEGAVARLKLATSLDATNRDAAFAAYSYYRSKVKDCAGRAELLVNLLMADPVDVQTHVLLAREMAAGGAFDAARRFQSNAATIFDRANVDQDSTSLQESLCVDWAVDGPDKVVSQLNKALATRRNDQRKLIEYMEQSLMPLAGIAKPEEVRLEPVLDRLRLLAAVAAHDATTVQAATADFRGSYDAAQGFLLNPPAGVPIDIADPAAEARAVRLERAVTLLWAGVEGEYVAKEIDEISAAQGQDPGEPLLLEARAWQVAAGPEPAKAIELFKAVPGDSTTVRIGLATALERAGRTQEAIDAWVAVMTDTPLTIESQWAWHRAVEISGRKDPAPDLAKRLRTIASGVPAWVDDAVNAPEHLMSLSAELVKTSLDVAEPASVRFKLTNNAIVPLGVGPGRTLDSRLLLSPSLEVGLESVREGVTPELADAERRLRLNPRESIEFTCWPDPGLSGWLAESLAMDAVRVRWRVLQGYTRGPMGQIVPGPMCLSTGTKSLVRGAMAETTIPAEQLADQISRIPESELDRFCIAARAILLASAEPEDAAKPGQTPAPRTSAAARLTPDAAALLARAFASRFPACTPAARRLMLASLPHASQVPAMKAFDDVAAADPDPSVLLVYLVTRVAKADDPVLARAGQSTSPDVRAVAGAVAERIGSDAPLFATLGPGLAGLRQAAAVEGDGAAPAEGSR